MVGSYKFVYNIKEKTVVLSFVYVMLWYKKVGSSESCIEVILRYTEKFKIPAIISECFIIDVKFAIINEQKTFFGDILRIC